MVDLVEDLLGRVAVPRQSEKRGRGGEQEGQRQVAPPTRRRKAQPFLPEAASSSTAYAIGTPNELPRNFESTAYSTATTWPLLLNTGPPLPPWVVEASNTMSVFVTSPMCPWVV